MPDASARAGSGGGIGVLIIKAVFATPLSDLHFCRDASASSISHSHSSDVVWFDLPLESNQWLRLGGAYFHSMNTSAGHSALQDNLSAAINSHNGPLIVGGDFNVHHHQWDKHVPYLHNQQQTNSNRFSSFLINQNLHQNH
jgi:hypothetical protein